jgi:pyruvate dehydrogenase E2 component (dihydrolipoamide acetyltransferase)
MRATDVTNYAAKFGGLARKSQVTGRPKGKDSRLVANEVRMPQMGESIAEGTLVKWHKKVGEKVKRDELLFEISTDKVDTEVPAPHEGYLLEVLVKEGETVPVHTVVCLLGASARPDGSVDPASKELSSAPASKAQSEGGAPRPHQRSVRSENVPAKPAAASESRLKEKSSPLVRRLAAEHGIDLSQLGGSGTSGRVTKEDILREIAGLQTGPVNALADDRVEPMSAMRQRIAEHMLASRRASAHVSTIFEVDMTEVRARKDSLAKEYKKLHAVKLTYMPFIVQAVARGLTKFPALNASVEGKNVRYHAQINVGIAVALDEGLIVPVVQQADKGTLVDIARSINDLALRAREKRLQPAEVQGGTFTITNPGVFGGLIGTPIINQPQVGILCIGAIQKRPIVLPDTDTIAARSMAFFSLSFDHRLIDGAVADRFLAEVKSILESGSL